MASRPTCWAAPSRVLITSWGSPKPVTQSGTMAAKGAWESSSGVVTMPISWYGSPEMKISPGRSTPRDRAATSPSKATLRPRSASP
ncbi:hypothetical protein [Acrocarpospora sp. B8E8]|uniref:hypothetical protein n=1 Tax=Acrocarpospora sp. B8E8 TaxID=3153572 RepID=UPI00325FB388